MARNLTAADFLTERRDFLRVEVVPGYRGADEGWDVVLRIDGTYSDRETAEEVAKAMKADIGALRDIPKDRWDAWFATVEPEVDIVKVGGVTT